MNALKKVVPVLTVMFLYMLKGISGEDGIRSYPSSLDAAFNLQWAKMAIQNTISHFLDTGEWKQVGCPYSNQTDAPFQYVVCFSDDEDPINVLHIDPAIRGVNYKEHSQTFYDDVVVRISKDANECVCDHHSFWTLSTWPWSSSHQFGQDFAKTGLVTKVFASEREDNSSQNYDACSPTPGDTVYICLAGVWEEKME